MPLIFRTRASLQAHLATLRRAGLRLGFVPTMGALHQGHLSLITLAKQHSDIAIASIFVNPTQFAPGEDFDTYPRTEAADLEHLGTVGCDIVYLPCIEDMYPKGNVTQVRVEGLSDLLDGQFRPHFFYGVTTVVARLFAHVQPDIAVFGEKDYQQLQIIKRMTQDLGLPIEIIGGPTSRDPDGLAQSSRNAYLSPEERVRANAMSAALHRAAQRLSIGTPIQECLLEAKSSLTQAGFTKIDYISAVDPQTLLDLPNEPIVPGFEGRILAAAWLGKTRLIDNMPFRRV